MKTESKETMTLGDPDFIITRVEELGREDGRSDEYYDDVPTISARLFAYIYNLPLFQVLHSQMRHCGCSVLPAPVISVSDCDCYSATLPYCGKI